MMNFNKVLTSKIISLILAVSFLMAGISYAGEYQQDSLRVPIGNYDRVRNVMEEQGEPGLPATDVPSASAAAGAAPLVEEIETNGAERRMNWENLVRDSSDHSTKGYVKIDGVYYVPASRKETIQRLAGEYNVTEAEVEQAGFAFLGIPSGAKVIYLSEEAFIFRKEDNNLALQYVSHPFLALYSISRVMRATTDSGKKAYVFGTGAGPLVLRLAAEPGIKTVVAIEKDHNQVKLLRRSLAANPELEKKVKEVFEGSFEDYLSGGVSALQNAEGLQPLLVANLPRDAALTLMKSLDQIFRNQAFLEQFRPITILAGLASEPEKRQENKDAINLLLAPYPLDTVGIEFEDSAPHFVTFYFAFISQVAARPNPDDASRRNEEPASAAPVGAIEVLRPLITPAVVVPAAFANGDVLPAASVDEATKTAIMKYILSLSRNPVELQNLEAEIEAELRHSRVYERLKVFFPEDDGRFFMKGNFTKVVAMTISAVTKALRQEAREMNLRQGNLDDNPTGLELSVIRLQNLETGEQIKLRKKPVKGVYHFDIWAKGALIRDSSLDVSENERQVVVSRIAVGNDDYSYNGQGIGWTILRYLADYAYARGKGIKIITTHNMGLITLCYEHLTPKAMYTFSDKRERTYKEVNWLEENGLLTISISGQAEFLCNLRFEKIRGKDEFIYRSTERDIHNVQKWEDKLEKNVKVQIEGGRVKVTWRDPGRKDPIYYQIYVQKPIKSITMSYEALAEYALSIVTPAPTAIPAAGVSATYKFPDSLGVEDDPWLDQDFRKGLLNGYHELTGSEVEGLIDDAIRKIKRRIAINLPEIKIRLLNNVGTSGIPRYEGAPLHEQDFVVGKKEEKSLILYVTPGFYAGHLKNNPLLLADRITHEFGELFAGDSHARVSRYLWVYTMRHKKLTIPVYLKACVDIALQEGDADTLQQLGRIASSSEPHPNDRQGMFKKYLIARVFELKARQDSVQQSPALRRIPWVSAEQERDIIRGLTDFVRDYEYVAASLKVKFIVEHWEDFQAISGERLYPYMALLEKLLESRGREWVAANWDDIAAIFKICVSNLISGQRGAFVLAWALDDYLLRSEDVHQMRLDVEDLLKPYNQGYLQVLNKARLICFRDKPAATAIASRIDELKKAKEAVNAQPAPQNKLMQAGASAFMADIDKRIASLQLEEKTEAAASLDRQFNDWAKQTAQQIREVLRQYQDILKREDLLILAQLGEGLDGIATVEAVSSAMLQRLGLEQTLTLQQQWRLEVLGYGHLITVNKETALKYQDKFLIAMSLLLGHEAWHILLKNPGGEESYRIVKPDFSAEGYSSLSAPETIMKVAEETAIDRLAWDMAVKLIGQGETAKALIALSEIAFDYFKEHADQEDSKETALKLARIEAQLTWLRSNQQLGAEADALREEIHSYAQQILEPGEMAVYSQLMNALQAHYGRTEMRFDSSAAAAPQKFLEKAAILLSKIPFDPAPNLNNQWVAMDSHRYQSVRWLKATGTGASATLSEEIFPGQPALPSAESELGLLYVPTTWTAVTPLSESDVIGTLGSDSCTLIAGYSREVSGLRVIFSHVWSSIEGNHYGIIPQFIPQLSGESGGRQVTLVTYTPLLTMPYGQIGLKPALDKLAEDFPQTKLVDRYFRNRPGGLIMTTEGIGLYEYQNGNYALTEFIPINAFSFVSPNSYLLRGEKVKGINQSL